MKILDLVLALWGLKSAGRHLLPSASLCLDLSPDVDAPDTSGMNQAAMMNAQTAKEMVELARQQQTIGNFRQAQFDPLFRQVINQGLASAKTADARSAQQWDQYVKNFMPAEQKLVDTAMNYDTPGRREAAAQAAAAGVGSQFADQRMAQNRALGRAGISMASGRALTLDNASRLTQAKATAAADTAARNQVEAAGMQLVDNAARVGRGLTATGLNAAALGTQASANAGNALTQQQATYNAALAPAMNLYNSSISGNASAGNIYGQIAQVQQASNATDMSGLAGLGSLVGQLGSAYILSSSRELKDVEGNVDREAALKSVRDTPVKVWTYKNGARRVHIGPMAEDVRRTTGIGDGKTLDVIDELGTLRASVQALDARLRRATGAGDQSTKPSRTQRLSLADARSERSHTKGRS
jgi:hypothetical protein